VRLDPRRWKPAVAAFRFWAQFVPNYLARRSFIGALRHALRPGAIAADVLHVHESSWLAGVAVEAGRRLGVPVLCKEASFPVLGVIGYDTPDRRHWDALRREACFQSQTPAGAAALEAAGVPASRVRVVPNGVERPGATADVRANSGVLYVGNFSQGAHWKAFDVLIEAWAIVRREAPGAQLTLAGGGDTTGWRDYARRLGCEASMIFTGPTDRPEAFYQRAAFLVLPSRVEGMSNVLLEAQAWGLPAVVSDIPGNLAVVDDGVNGLVAPVNDAPALARAILRLLREPDLRARLGEGARRSVDGEFAIDRVAARLASLYAALRERPSCAS
jgi:glycosyltransferase involved in cell wall biosynthesis